MPSSTLVILNPKAGRGAARFGRIESVVRKQLDDVEFERTRGPGDASRIAREAVRAGVGRVVVGGGDGTVSEVVTGILDADLGGYVQLGLLPIGSGCDFARSVGVPERINEAVALLASGRSQRVDAGRIRYRAHDGEEETGYFLNEASFGLSGLTVDLVNRAGKRMGPTLAFALGSVGAILRGCEPDVRIRVDERVVHEGPISMVVCANGRYFGSGMQIAPGALVDDGVLDVMVIEQLPRHRLLARFPSLYKGTHTRYPEVAHHRGTRVEATLRVAGDAMIDVDGEPLGELPVTMELLPKALSLFGLPERAPALGARD